LPWNISLTTATSVKLTCNTIIDYAITGLDIPSGLQEFEAATISRQSAHEGGKDCQPYAPAVFSPKGRSLVLIYVKG
jgi:hypothetical protein